MMRGLCYNSAMDTITQVLTGTSTGGTSGFDLNSLMSSLAPFILGSTILTALLVILYAVSVIGKYRANKAILDIKKVLIEMNERDKFRDGMSKSPDIESSTPKAAPIEAADVASPTQS